LTGNQLPCTLNSVDLSAIQYELLIKKLLAMKLYCDEAECSAIKHRNRYKGASGQEHEIDLSFETTLAGSRLLVLVECKCYSRPVGIEDLAEFAYKLRDIGAHKGIVVSTVGFREGAITIARREGIALVVAVKAWTVVSLCRSDGTPRYTIGKIQWASIQLNDSRRQHTIPMGTMASSTIDEDSTPGEISFYPVLADFHGDPFASIFEAARIFLFESGLAIDGLETFGWHPDEGRSVIGKPEWTITNQSFVADDD
jgi:hypothetical protein